jgi:hypothetical protein
MKFESLANEVLLDIFDYLGAIDLFRIFHPLNIRFQQLLLNHTQKYHVNFQSISRRDFDYFRRECIPSIINQITSLHFSDDFDTPQ